jgi:hypothetical protein
LRDHQNAAVPKQLKISATNLALLAMEEACPLCWYTLSTIRWKKPFVYPMPGVMQYHDRTQKYLLAELIKRDQKLPDCFKPYQDVRGIAPIVKVEYIDPETGLLLYGYPDFVAERENGSVLVFDNKTAKLKGDDSPLYWAYNAQVNIYAHLIAKGAHNRRVDGAALFYFRWPQVIPEDILDYWYENRLHAPLEPVVQPVELDFDEIVCPLILKAHGLLSGAVTPTANPDCRDCASLQTFLKAQSQIKASSTWAMDARTRQRLAARQRFIDACRLGIDTAAEEQFAPPCFGHEFGMVANWDYSDRE